MIKDKTVITIAHRLATIQKCDRKFFIKDKTVRESETYSELMNAKGNYYNVYKN